MSRIYEAAMGTWEMKRFGLNVREHRNRAGLSQEALAESCGLHRTYVGGIERGERNLGLLNIVRLADALNVEPKVLMEGLGKEGGCGEQS